MKDLLTNKAKFEETSKATLNERCSILLLNKIPLKDKDLWSFTISCAIGRVGVDKALADLGASISLMPYLMFVRLELGKLKPSRMCIELANKSTQYPMGIVENVIVKIEKFVFHVDFVFLDIEKDFRDCQPSKDINLWEDDSEVAINEEKLRNSLDSSYTPGLFSDLDDFEPEYAILDGNQEFLVIISSLLSHHENALLLQVLSKHKATLAWNVADIKGISLSFCMHNILMEDNFKPVVQPQSRLNPKVQDMVKAEIVKLLDAGLIYSILDSPWISPIHVVPKKGGMTVITSEKNEIFHYPLSIKC
ncbi:DNA-directed DNA polymerase [Tanacetum coccineum]